MKKYLLLILIFGIHHSILGQKQVAEVTTDKVVRGMRGMTIGDDVFLNVSLVDPETRAAPERKSYWIHADGKLSEVDLGMIGIKSLFAVAATSDSAWYYYVEESRKNVIIKAWELDNRTGKGEISRHQIDLPGKLFGSYIEEGDLFLICAIKGSFTLRLVQIRGVRVKKETNFSLSFDLGRNEKATVSFFQAGGMAAFPHTSSQIKLTKDGQAIWITVDEPMSTYEDRTSSSSLAKTSVIRLDLMTGESDIKVFYDPSHGYFSSCLSNGHLFRVLRDHGFRMDIFNFEDEKKIYTTTISAKADYSGDAAYTRSGYNLTVWKDPIVRRVIRNVAPPFVMVDSSSTHGLIVTLGNYDKVNSNANFLVTPYFVLPELIQVAALSLQELEDKDAYVYQYFYLKGSLQHGFSLTNESSLIRQRIDDYEYKQQSEKVKFRHKGYLNCTSGVYGIYQVAESPVIRILKFEK